MFLFLASCTNPTAPAGSGDTPSEVQLGITLTTRDDVDLVADIYVGEAGANGVVLLHMTPAGPWNRTDWPQTFITMLQDNGWWVLALDRRGAGGSGGVAQDAFVGPSGKFDVEAAVVALSDRGAGAPVLIGASNGTTSALDYTLWAGGQGLPEPVALGFMTGGDYTETNHPLSGVEVPVVFTYSTAESTWSTGKQAGAPTSWSFLEYPGGDHGTQMFEPKPEVSGDIESFLQGVL